MLAKSIIAISTSRLRSAGLAAFTTVLATAIMASASSGFAKDWIEKVEVKRDGIDVQAIEVLANAGGYVAVKTGTHRFPLHLFARATNGERIVAMKLGAYRDVLYFETSGSNWNQSFKGRDVGAGTKRTVSITHSPVIPVNKLSWHGSDPKRQCELNLQQQMKAGLSKAEVLSKAWSVSARAYFELDAVAARRKEAENNKWSLKNTSNQRRGMTYEVTVKCNPGLSS